ncbi:MAG: nuclear transport factor 2 family protein [Bacteroidales bacterium]
MKRISIVIFLAIVITSSCVGPSTENQSDATSDDQIEMLTKHKQVATTYHDLKAENVDSIFTEDFVGKGELGHTWDLESHRKFLSNGSYKVDSINYQIAEGEWVATMFFRTMDYQGERITVPAMHFKRFEGNKIAEVWEYYDFNMPDPEQE